MLHTRIIIRHSTADTLRSSELWAQIMALPFCDDGPLAIVEIARDESPDPADEIDDAQDDLNTPTPT